MKPPQGVGPGELARLAVTRSLRLRLSLLPLLAVATLLSCRVAVLRPSEEPHPTPLNATWLRLAAGPPTPALVGEAELEDLFRDVAAAASARRLSPALWRQLRRLESTVSAPRLVAETRAALRNWSRRRRYDPGVMRELSSLFPGGSTRYPTCAVVGNSGILLRSEHGDLIDRHQLVIRLNNARIHGYQKNVGTKTSLSFVNSNILHHCAQRPGCFCHPYGDHVPLLMYICQATHFLDYVTCNATGAAPILLTDARFDLLCARIVKYYSIRQFVAQTGRSADDWNRSHDAKLFHYSSGMQAVMLAVGICDEVSLFGFGKSEAAKHHYHTNQKKELDLHDYEAEYLLYRDLAERPRRVPFLADSGFRVPPVVMYR